MQHDLFSLQHLIPCGLIVGQQQADVIAIGEDALDLFLQIAILQAIVQILALVGA